jgi:hypothetical protein
VVRAFALFLSEGCMSVLNFVKLWIFTLLSTQTNNLLANTLNNLVFLYEILVVAGIERIVLSYVVALVDLLPS